VAVVGMDTKLVNYFSKLKLRVGKTTFALELIKKQHFTKPIKNVYYFGCTGGQIDKLNWHSQLPDIAVNYHGM